MLLCKQWRSGATGQARWKGGVEKERKVAAAEQEQAGHMHAKPYWSCVTSPPPSKAAGSFLPGWYMGHRSPHLGRDESERSNGHHWAKTRLSRGSSSLLLSRHASQRAAERRVGQQHPIEVVSFSWLRTCVHGEEVQGFSC